MFLGNFADEGDNLVNTQTYIINVEGDSRLSPCLQPLTTGIVLKICGFFQSGSVIVFSIPEIILLSYKTKH